MGETKNEYKILVGNPEMTRALTQTRRITLAYIGLKEKMCG
jgi:hypothetical protein